MVTTKFLVQWLPTLSSATKGYKDSGKDTQTKTRLKMARGQVLEKRPTKVLSQMKRGKFFVQ